MKTEGAEVLEQKDYLPPTCTIGRWCSKRTLSAGKFCTRHDDGTSKYLFDLFRKKTCNTLQFVRTSELEVSGSCCRMLSVRGTSNREGRKSPMLTTISESETIFFRRINDRQSRFKGN